jgi:diguanylate cyclase (GGDEF)-like protein
VTTTEDGALLPRPGEDFGGALTQFLIGYFQMNTPEGTVDEMLRLAGETRSVETLSDVNSWTSYRQYRRLLEATGAVVRGPAPLADVGSHVFDAIRHPELMEILRSLGSPAAAYGALAAGIETFAPAVETKIDVISENECWTSARMKAPNQAFRLHCSFQFSLLATVPQIFGFASAEILDEVCQCDGAPSCSVRLRWASADDEASQVARLEMRSRLGETRLEELQHTVAELVSGDGLHAVLTRVVAAARRAVHAVSFVLDVRPSVSFDRFTHTAGIDEAAGAEITRRIRDDTTEVATNILVSGVVSDRSHYGHLVAIRPEKASFDRLEQTVLNSYAGLIASALDTEVAIMEARRQATAAQALLALSSALADLTSTEEMVERLGRAVASVVDCDMAVVSLTEPGGATARVRATYGFDPAIDAELRALQIGVTPQLPDLNSLYYHPQVPGVSVFDDTVRAAGSLRSCAYAIASNTVLYGWITVAVRVRPERLDDEDALAERLRGLAGQATVALRNARLLDEIRHQALHDDLTGLPNRALILDRVSHALARARRERSDLALFFVDLDGFKDVNDNLGHGAGDDLLRAVAGRFSATLRDSDTVARLGGDEFVVLAEGVSLAAGPDPVAARLLGVFAEPFQLGEDLQTIVSISASVGVAVGLRDSAEDLFSDADVALYAAKDAGKNRAVVFEEHMGDALRGRHQMEMDLQAAVGTDQFFLVYQPIFDLADMVVIGVEALLRWQHPTRGLLQPDQFFPALEASRLIIPVGRWVIVEACRQAMVWRSEGQMIDMSVNASARQLDAGSLLDDVSFALSVSGLPASALTVEITETCLMRDTEGALGQLTALKGVGVRIAIDDFGTGYSSLAYLQQFPVDSIKIDRSFISAMSKSAEGDALIHTLIQLGKVLNLETVAEGIEESAQLDQLQAEHCQTGQGYLVARPLLPDQVEKFFRQAIVDVDD